MKKHNCNDLSQMPVQQSPCKTCPFEGESPINLTLESKATYTDNVASLRGQHFCHSVDNKMICRGGRNLMLQSLLEHGLITEATDQAYEEARKQILGF